MCLFLCNHHVLPAPLKETMRLAFNTIFTGPREIQFIYNAGGSIQVLQVKTPDHLDNNVWHTVLAERNRKEARFTIDDFRPTYISESPSTFRDFYLTSDMVIGKCLLKDPKCNAHCSM